MRQTRIPAQITTIEDKIAGNLSFMQILLLMIPIVTSLIIYALLTPTMRIASYKVILFMVITCISMVLALRIKKRVVLQWLIMISRFNLRPRFYLFSKHDLYQRELIIDKAENVEILEKASQKTKAETKNQSVSELALIQQFLKDPSYSLSFKSGKGGIHVAFEQVRS